MPMAEVEALGPEAVASWPGTSLQWKYWNDMECAAYAGVRGQGANAPRKLAPEECTVLRILQL